MFTPLYIIWHFKFSNGKHELLCQYLHFKNFILFKDVPILDIVYNMHFCPKDSQHCGFQFPKWKNYLRMLGHLWKGIWILGHYHNLMPLSYLNLNHEPKVKVMTKLMSTTPPNPHACYKISKHKRWNSIKYPRDKAHKCEIVQNPCSYPLGFQK